MKIVCQKCFEDVGLKERIKKIESNFPNHQCDFHKDTKGIPINEAIDIIEPVFRMLYHIAEYDTFNRSQMGEPFDYVLADFIKTENHEILDAIISQLIDGKIYDSSDGDEPFFQLDQNYERYGVDGFYNYYSDQWDRFCESIIHDQRFFNTNAKSIIYEIFDGIDLQKDSEEKSPVYLIKPGDKEAQFYRARIAKSEQEEKGIKENPVLELGPPPSRLRRAGRMNADGVACFYGAYDLKTCIAEINPIVGATIIGAKFELIRPIVVLDTTHFKKPIKQESEFNEDYSSKLEQWNFMKLFMKEISRPIVPNEKHIDYIPTQAAAEYFLKYHSLKVNDGQQKVEAIIFESSQYQKGKNIVLLGDAALVENLSTDEEKQDNAEESSSVTRSILDTFMTMQKEHHNYGICVLKDSIESHKVNGVQYETRVFDRYNHDFKKLS